MPQAGLSSSTFIKYISPYVGSISTGPQDVHLTLIISAWTDTMIIMQALIPLLEMRPRGRARGTQQSLESHRLGLLGLS